MGNRQEKPIHVQTPVEAEKAVVEILILGHHRLPRSTFPKDLSETFEHLRQAQHSIGTQKATITALALLTRNPSIPHRLRWFAFACPATKFGRLKVEFLKVWPLILPVPITLIPSGKIWFKLRYLQLSLTSLLTVVGTLSISVQVIPLTSVTWLFSGAPEPIAIVTAFIEVFATLGALQLAYHFYTTTGSKIVALAAVLCAVTNFLIRILAWALSDPVCVNLHGIPKF